MRLFHGMAVVFATLIAVPAAAQGQVGGERSPENCQIRIDTSSANWIVQNYDPFGSTDPSANFDLILTNLGTTRCQIYAQFATDQQPFGLTAGFNNRASYRLYDVFAGVDVTPLSGRSIRTATTRSVIIAPGGQQLLRYQFEANGSELQGDGTFTQQLAVEVQGFDGTPLLARQIVVGVNVLPSAVLGLSGAFDINNGQAVVDLGELVEGTAAIPLQLRVKSTRAYSLELASKNNGKLLLADTQWAVPYQVVVGDRSLSLAGAAIYTSDKSAQRPNSESLPIRFAIGDTQNKRAGTYSDVLTVTISPN